MKSFSGHGAKLCRTYDSLVKAGMSAAPQVSIVAEAAAETHGASFAVAMGAIDLNLQHQPTDPVFSPLVAGPRRRRAGVYDGCRLGFAELQ